MSIFERSGNWHLLVVFLIIGCIVFSLFAAVPIHSASPFGILSRVSGLNKADMSHYEHLTNFDVNLQAKRMASYDSLIDFYTTYTRNRTIAETIVQASFSLEIPLNLAFALAWQESRFNPRALSRPNKYGTRDWGLFQLNDGYRKEWTVSDFFDVRKNTYTALLYLRGCIEQMGTTRLGLAAYNAGMHRVQTRGIPPMTRRYIDNILAYERKLDLAFSFYCMKNRDSKSL
jgi:soluble lytic murein transglycosylase-like protein